MNVGGDDTVASLARIDLGAGSGPNGNGAAINGNGDGASEDLAEEDVAEVEDDGNGASE
jgi:hypothetical protein